jgi:hypothetical protein
MNRNARDLLEIYKYPGIALLLIMLPGMNKLYFDKHSLLTPILGMVLIYCLPLYTPYILFRLLRLMRSARGELTVTSTPARNPGLLERTLFHRRYGSLSFVLFLGVMYPVSYCAAASLNWGGIWGMHWKPYVLYKMSTFPIGFALPPYQHVNQETIDTMLTILESMFQ